MESSSFEEIDDYMSYWTLESKADIGLRVFSNNMANLFRETALGTLNLLINSKLSREVNHQIRQTAQWNVSVKHKNHADYDILMIAWLEEILYRLEVHEEFLVDCYCKITERVDELIVEAQVSWVNANHVIRDFEIKAVTSHQFLLKQLLQGEVLTSENIEIPQMIGPGWVCEVIFDI